jgi:hypothetical protein
VAKSGQEGAMDGQGSQASRVLPQSSTVARKQGSKVRGNHQVKGKLLVSIFPE